MTSATLPLGTAAQESQNLKETAQLKPMEIKLGPSHPAMHGTIRITVQLDGETISSCNTEVGFLHRGFEKECETVHWAQCMPYTDRLNYVSPLINNFGFAAAVEKLCGVEIPDRAKYIRTLAAEISRMCDHITCCGAMAMEVGGFTPYLYMIEARDLLWDLIEELTGARVTVNYARIGGVAHDVPKDWSVKVPKILDKVFKLIDDTNAMLTRNRIFVDRMNGVGAISKEDCIDYGITGPWLRAAGVEYDIRKQQPYDAYADAEFDIPVGDHGDCYDRWLVRLEEIRQSRRIVLQMLKRMPSGSFLLHDPRFVLPPKDEVYTSIEGLMNHFKLIIEGAQVPVGEVYAYSEGANGELGFFIVSDGSGKAYKCHLRSPCWANMQPLDTILLPGSPIADVVPIFGSVNMIGGECDR